ncbi:MAG TPA: gluconolaconase, partial [Mycobacterium sp.]|nr:gluconolaconase [Mycobacterium sp.]
MRVWLQHKRIGLVAILLLAACSTSPAPTPQPSSTTPTTEAAAALVPVTVQVAPDLAQQPFDEPRQALVPSGWTLSVWARIPKARLAVWAPDGALLVSVPSSGQVLHLTPGGAAPRESVLLDGLDQPHGLAFA